MQTNERRETGTQTPAWSKQTLAAILLAAVSGSAAASAQQVFSEDFETGGPAWTSSAGIWEIGVPAQGPSSTPSGVRCAATRLAANYTGYADSRLIYPTPSGSPILLPVLQGDEELRLRFMNWFSYSSYDYGYVQVSSRDVGGVFSAWTAVPMAKTLDGWYGTWHQRDVDLTKFAGKEVQLGFFHTANRDQWGNASESTGWFIDDVEIEKITPQFTGDFNEIRDWTVEDGLWELGEPGAGPPAAHSRPNCAGTVLNGNYHGYRDSRLISPAVQLPAVVGSETRFLTYYQWWSYSSYDAGKIQVSVLDPVTGDWGAWADLAGSPVAGVSANWTKRELDLTSYAGSKIRISFLHQAGRDQWGNASESTGWYIDEVHITEVHEAISTFCTGDLASGLCPCSNGSLLGASEGCVNTTGRGARLYITGSNDVAADDMVLRVQQGAPTTYGVFIQSASTVAIPFRDGVLCLGNPIRRLSPVTLDAAGAADSTSFSVVTEGNVTAGDIRFYQFWFRDNGGNSTCGNGSNLTNGVRVDWR